MGIETALILGGGALLGSAISGHAATSAADTQAAAANRAADVQQHMFDTTRADQAPWRAAGETALGQIGGMQDFFNHQFNADDLKANLAPNYDFMLKQGQGATTAQSNAMGGLGGNSLADITKFTTGYAQQGYQQAYQNYTANQTNIFNRLSAIAGLGQTAGSNQTTGGSTYGANIGSALQGVGNAQAAGQVGAANAWSSGIGNISNFYALSNLLGKGSSTLAGGAT